MLAILTKLPEILRNWWSEFTLQTRLMAGATLVVSLLMSGLTFWAVNTIQQDARLNDTRYGRDLGLLLAANVAPMIAENNREEVARFSRQFYTSTSSVRYMLYADPDGEIFLGLPFSDSAVQNSLTLRRRMQLPENFLASVEARDYSALPMVRQHLTPGGQITDVFVPLMHDDKYLGILAIGINPNPTVVVSSNLTRDVTLAVFVSIWVMVILGAVFNALTITQPIKELLMGVKNIAAGNFRQRIDLPFGGELGELILSFNEMAERLESYDEQNIEELTAEKAKLETLVSTIADGAVLIDAELNLILVNPTARRLFGWERQSVISENVLTYLPAPVLQELSQPLQKIASGNLEGGEFRCSLTEPNNRTLRILLTTVLLHKSPGVEPLCASCIYDHDNSCTSPQRPQANECTFYNQDATVKNQENYRESLKGIAMTIQDITREVELNDAKSQFISNVSHELRTPLFNIKSFIETLHDYGDDLSEEERREFLETANHETDRLTRLVNDVLDLSRLESCRIYHLEPVDIAHPIEQTLRTYQLNARDKGIELSKEVEPLLPAVRGHFDLLLQVLTNLVGNSLKFTEAGGRVIIRAYLLDDSHHISLAESREAAEIERGGWIMSPPPPRPLDRHISHNSQLYQRVVRIEVSDTGSGIASEDQEAVFTRFFRVENRVHTLEGTGLGLSIVRNIIEKHNSQVHLVSELGVGTTFWFDLAVYQEDQQNLIPDVVAPAMEFLS
ncbi:ATP-binding protein [Limnospira fusiformis KN01]|uniref:histidine kinase n=3 Tax=Limnospira TaxID=2596745 RepID=A0A9P1KF45_9CYAN|nr:MULTISPECIES: ATP-binding protein [Limnospira]EKD06214.1 multi-sensor signal transduction histidine kinase [Arthrospira platensis C1]MDC0836916.1 ATP-binding protein [Limnoraphis robusta]MDY7054897.1 ATP-binding protein [Limnospira fusiformis LS22]QJB26753.1 HAMP domain-containing protein [Limnospira fusiformis SAG 85.79]EDZ94868.1 multi-sensor signal transduction histidine kinase [Limnospira maxima CS-328]